MTNIASIYTKTLICIVGPTAVGKTALAIQLAKEYKTEIISADSRQFYREMNIGTAKPIQEELASIPHHFINSHSVNDEYSAGDYEKEALNCIEKLFKEKDVLILVGGSGLFINAVCTGLDNLPKPATGIREKIIELFQEKGLDFLQEQLKNVDPSYYAEVDLNNPQRIIRALEVFQTTNIPFSAWRKKDMDLRKFNIITIGVNIEREQLYEQINRRVDMMISNGLLNEVKRLLPYKGRTPLLSVGYSELFDYFDGKCSLEEAIEKIKQNTRRYAKRQLTWFKKNKNMAWFQPNEVSAITNYIESLLKDKNPN